MLAVEGEDVKKERRLRYGGGLRVDVKFFVW